MSASGGVWWPLHSLCRILWAVKHPHPSWGKISSSCVHQPWSRPRKVPSSACPNTLAARVHNLNTKMKYLSNQTLVETDVGPALASCCNFSLCDVIHYGHLIARIRSSYWDQLSIFLCLFWGEKSSSGDIIPGKSQFQQGRAYWADWTMELKCLVVISDVMSWRIVICRSCGTVLVVVVMRLVSAYHLRWKMPCAPEQRLRRNWAELRSDWSSWRPSTPICGQGWSVLSPLLSKNICLMPES